MKISLYIFFLGSLILNLLSNNVRAQPIYKKSICPSKTYSEYENQRDVGESHNRCDSDTRIGYEILSGEYLIDKVELERTHNHPLKVKTKIYWKGNRTGKAKIVIRYQLQRRKCDLCGCYWQDPSVLHYYEITKESLDPVGILGGTSVFASTGNENLNISAVYNEGGQQIKAEQIKYWVNGSYLGTVSKTPGATSLILNYQASKVGEYLFTTEVKNECGDWFPGPSRTVYVKPSCYTDNASSADMALTGEGITPHPEGLELTKDVPYSVNISGITDFDAHYELVHDGDNDINLENKTLTVLSGLGSYRLEAVKKEGRDECPNLEPLHLFLGGKDITIEDDCLIRLPSDLSDLGYEPKPDEPFLKYFAANVKSKRGFIIKPGITLTKGAELILDYTAPAIEDGDPDEELNFIQSTSYDEYNRIIAQSRQYFDERGLATQSQSKIISENTVMASQVLYDARGRAVISTLPAPVQTRMVENDGCEQDVQRADLVQFKYKENFVTDNGGNPYDYTNFALAKEENPDPVGSAEENTLGWYYGNNNSIDPLVATTQFPYSRTLFYHDGSGEVKSATQPGDAFRAGGGHLGTTNNIQVENNDPYLQNYFAIRQNELELSSPEVYQGNFFKNVSTDAEKRKSVSYVDLSGKAIVSLYFGDQATPITRSYEFYNDVGQLIASLTPNGWEQYDGSNFDKVDKTTYTYDGRGRMIAMKETDAGETRYVYRNDGSIRFSQNAEQEVDGRYSYTNYDSTGRPVESGEYKPGAGGITFQSPEMKAILENETRNGGLSESLGTKTNRLKTFYDLPDPALPVDRTQRFLDGAVSYTQNSETTTWYSYDGRGRVEWIVQDLGVLGIKTLDYRYGPLGNVQEVAYQAENDDEDFYHFYEYDLDGRLTNVYTSTEKLLYNEFGEVTNREALTGQAEYQYYLHGPLKRVELAGNLQGIDYIYTANGALKSINHADQTKDPGNDQSDVNGFRSDVFGMTLDYYNNDYTGAGYSAGNLSLSGHDEQFTGNIRALSWHSPVDGGTPRTYAYDYDDRYQLSGATFGSFTGVGGAYTFTGSPLQAYQVNIPQIDLNGNIKTLQRKGEMGAFTANFRYNYEGNTNKLLNVQHGDNEYSAYRYNKIGQMTRQEKGDETWFLQYDVTGKVKGVYQSFDEATKTYSNPLAIYTYDDRGFRLSKTNFDDEGNARLKTWYVRDASGSVVSTYRQNLAGDDDPEQYEVPIYGAGRLGIYRPHALLGNYLYELNDHLGNVRAVIGEGITLEYLATMETERDETDYFTINNKVPTAGFINHTPGTVTVDGQEEAIASPNEVVRMNNAITGMQTAIGATFKTRVYPGDSVNMEVYVKYSNFETNEVDILPTIVSYLESSFGLPATADGPLEIFDFMNAPEFASLAAWDDVNDNQPRAFLNYIVFDDKFQVQDFGVQQVGEEAEIPADGSAMTHPHEKLELEVTIEKQGYIYVYLSVDDRQNMDVYWDDFKVTHKLNDIVAGGDYYPFGSVMAGREITRDDYRFGYQGQFAEKDEETGWNAFELRMYDPVIGRWLSTDPAGQYWSPYVGMGNEPIYGIDPDGAFKWWGGAAWYAMWNGGGTVSKNNDGVWQVIQGGGGITQIEGVGNVIDGVTVITSWNQDGPDRYAPTVGMIKAQEEYWNSLSMPQKIALTGDPSLDGIEPNYFIESWFVGGAILRGLGAARSSTATARSLGIAGERAVGITGPKTAINVAGRTRIPDAMTRTTLTEVKNVKSLSFTRQLRDFHSFSQQTGRDFILYTRPNTTLSGPLQNAINQGTIIHRYIPF